MTRFLPKLLMLSLPLVLLAVAEVALPVDAFTFRGWEALSVSPLLGEAGRLRLPVVTALPGPFLPGVSLELVEEGDLGHHTEYAQPRRVAWEVDRHGYRARPHLSDAPELVVGGDSNVAGSGATQDDTLAEMMRADHGIVTYPFAPSGMAAFLADVRFRERPPRLVVIECVERNVLEQFEAVAAPGREPRVLQSATARKLEFALTRIKQLSSLEFLRARLRPRRVIAHGGMLFLKGAAAVTPADPRRVALAARTLARLTAPLRDREIEAAVMIVPDKETIYSDLLPGAPVPTLLPALHAALRERRVPVIDLEPVFRAARARGGAPYFVDDTHWSPEGTRLAASVISEWAKATPSSGAPGVAARAPTAGAPDAALDRR